MLKLFDPQTKVQKDRKLIKETDMRMAKYSRRGIISNFLIYVLCLFFEGTFIHEQHSLAIVLTSGLLFVTLVRGYFLFRMDAIYPKGPTAWRNKYFLATLAGASWWGFILASFTLYLNLKGESSLMWLYTVVFFSTTAHAFAPYKRFLSIYQFIGLVPASLCTFFIGEYIGVFYGLVLLFFYVILNHHCSLMSLNYWERLEAQYILAKKSLSLEEEKRDTRASVQLTNEYIQLLSKKLGRLANDSESTAQAQQETLRQLFVGVDDFRKVLTKEIQITEVVFNVRHLVQNLVRSVVDEAEARGLEFETSLSPALPARMVGDSFLVERILSIMINNILRSAQNCILIIDAEFVRDFEDSGQLLITISRQASDSKRTLFQNDENIGIPVDLALVLAKGLAETLNGSLFIDEIGAIEGKYLILRCPLKVAEVGARPEYHRLAYKGRSLLLIHDNNHVLNLKRLELEAMGFDVQTSLDFKSAYQILKGALSAGAAIQSVIYMATPGVEAAVNFCNELLEHNELKYIHQFVVCSSTGQEFFSTRAVIQSPLIHYVDKPAGFFEFEAAFCTVFEVLQESYLNVLDSDQPVPSPEKNPVILWYALDKNFDYAAMYESEFATIECVADLKQVKKYLEQSDIKVIVVEYTNIESLACIQFIRAEEQRLNKEALLPIVGVGPASERVNMLIGGVDYFIDTKNVTKGNVPALSFWIKGGHH